MTKFYFFVSLLFVAQPLWAMGKTFPYGFSITSSLEDVRFNRSFEIPNGNPGGRAFQVQKGKTYRASIRIYRKSEGSYLAEISIRRGDMTPDYGQFTVDSSNGSVEVEAPVSGYLEDTSSEATYSCQISESERACRYDQNTRREICEDITRKRQGIETIRTVSRPIHQRYQVSIVHEGQVVAKIQGRGSSSVDRKTTVVPCH